MANENNKKIKVLNVVVRLSVGGIEKWLLNILHVYDRSQFQIDFCCVGIRSDLGQLSDEAKQLGSLVHYVSIRNPLRFFTQLRKVYLRYKYNVLICHVYPSLPILILAKLAGFPVLVDMYHNSLPSTNSNIKSFLFNLRILRLLSARMSQVVTGCSKTTLDGLFPDWRRSKKFRPLYYGVPDCDYTDLPSNAAVRKELGISTSVHVIGHVGRFVPQKNHRAFVKVAEIITESYSDVEFVLVGDGVLKPMIEEMVLISGLSHKFHFLGVRNDVSKLLRAMDIAFFPSLYEGSPVTFIEAQMAGLPVLTGIRPELIEAICPENREYLNLDTSDHVNAAKRIVYLLNDTHLLKKISKNGKSWAYSLFSIEESTKNYQKVLLEAIRIRNIKKNIIHD